MMYKILFDDNFYRNTEEQTKYFKELVDVIKQYFNVKIAYFTPFNSSPKTLHSYFMHQNINKKITDTEIAEKYDLNSVNEISDSVLEKQMGFTKLFIGKLKHIKTLNPDAIIIVPLCYAKKNKKLKTLQHYDYIFYIGNYDGEINSNIVKWICNNEPINIPNPSKAEMFPAKNLCNRYDTMRSEILQSFQDKEKEADFDEIGAEVACRNHYTYDHKLSELNKRKAKPIRDKKTGKKYQPKRKVFKTSAIDVIYLSIDFENGGFEVYDKNAKHLGQYRFNGEFEKDSKNKPHPLYLK